MSCLRGRTAVIELKDALKGKNMRVRRVVNVAFPAAWSEDTFLSYVRSAHPNEEVSILGWGDFANSLTLEPMIWLANPADFSDYRAGVLA